MALRFEIMMLDTPTPQFKFVLRLGPQYILFEYQPGDCKKEWKELVEAIQYKTNSMSILWNVGPKDTHEICYDCDTHQIEFYLSSYIKSNQNSNQGFETTISIPAAICEEAFLKAHHLVHNGKLFEESSVSSM